MCGLCGRLIVGPSTTVSVRQSPVKLPPDSGASSYTLTFTESWCASCADILPPLPYDPTEPDYAD